MSVSNGENITLIEEDRGVFGNGDTIELDVVGLTQRSNVDKSIIDLNLELGVYFADNRRPDLDVTAFGPPKQAILVYEGKGGSVCATALFNHYATVEMHFG